MEWYLKVLKNYADFSGRARREEYWMYTLFNVLAMLVLGGVFFGIAMALDAPAIIFLVYLYVFATLIPTLAVVVRRLHDTGKSGWWILLNFVPFGNIVLLVFLCTDSEHGKNKWGDNPKGIGNDSQISNIGLE